MQNPSINERDDSLSKDPSWFLELDSQTRPQLELDLVEKSEGH